MPTQLTFRMVLGVVLLAVWSKASIAEEPSQTSDKADTVVFAGNNFFSCGINKPPLALVINEPFYWRPTFGKIPSLCVGRRDYDRSSLVDVSPHFVDYYSRTVF